MAKDTMLCPLCKEELSFDSYIVVNGVMGDESTTKNICVNDDCPLCRKSFWDSSGEYYSGELTYNESDKLFPDDKYSAYNSFAKNAEISIYKKGLRKKFMMHQIFCLYILKPYIECNYKADNMGNILKRSYRLQFLSKNEHGYCIHYISGVHMFKFCIKKYYRVKKHFLKKKTLASASSLKEEMKREGWDKRWWCRLYHWYLDTFEKKMVKEIDNFEKNNKKAKQFKMI